MKALVNALYASGKRTSLAAGLFRAVLSAVSILYGICSRLHRFLYAVGILQSVRLPCPVISVGNLTAGGTGKTPMAEALARWLHERGMRVAILSRGYGKIGPGSDDEALLDAPEGIRRFTHPNRARLARHVTAEWNPDIVILDDGYQHYRIRRNLDILLVDSLNPFSNGRLLPRGLLREKPREARRADLIVLTRSDLVEPDRLGTLRALLDRHAPGTPVLEAVHKVASIESLGERRKVPLGWLRGREVMGVCAIGNPEGFKRTLVNLGAVVNHFFAFPDHHKYSPQDYRQINVAAKEFMAEAVVTTLKDALKLCPADMESPVLVVRVELRITRGMETLEERLRCFLSRPRPVRESVLGLR